MEGIGDPNAFGAFYRRHVDGVLAFFVRRTDAETGADLCAETFAAALAGLARYDTGRGEPVAWLYGIARHLLGRYHRSGSVERRAQRRLGMERILVDDEELARIDQSARSDVTARLLHDAMAGLPSDQRDALVARVLDESSYEEIGRRGSVTATAARQRVSRGLAHLRARIGASR